MGAYDFACVWKDSEATGSALLVHMALADCAINGIARVRHEDLARLSRLHVASVGRAIEQLATSGQIIIAEPKAGTRPAQIVVWPTKASAYATLSELPAYEFANATVTAPDTPVMQKLLDDGWINDDPGPTEIIDPLLDAIMGEPDEPPGYAWSAPTAIQPVVPPRTPPAMLIAPGDVARVLNAAGVPKNEEMPAYWWRTEHKADLADLCERLDVTVDVIVQRLMRSGQTAPDLRRIGDLEPLVRG